MISVLRNSGEELRHTFYVDGVATDADGAVTIHITKADGTDLAAVLTATTYGTTGQYKYILAPQATLNLLTVTWTGTFGGVVMSQVDQVEIVGGVYVSVSELIALSGLSADTAQAVATKRTEFADLAERYNGVAWVPRFAREKYAGRGGSSLLLDRVRPRTILSATSTDTAGTVTAFTTTNWQVLDHGLLVTDGDALTCSAYGERNLTIEYEHGHDAPPEVLRDACCIWVRDKLLRERSQVGRKVLSEQTPDGFTQRFGTANWREGRPTGIEEVDEILNGLGRAAPMVA